MHLVQGIEQRLGDLILLLTGFVERLAGVSEEFANEATGVEVHCNQTIAGCDLHHLLGSGTQGGPGQHARIGGDGGSGKVLQLGIGSPCPATDFAKG